MEKGGESCGRKRGWAGKTNGAPPELRPIDLREIGGRGHLMCA